MELFLKGGPVMFFLALLSIYGLGVIFFKIYQFAISNLFERSYIEPTLSYVKQGDLEQAQRVLNPVNGPIARIMRTCMAQVMDRTITQQAKEAEIARVGSADVHYLESHLRSLEMISNVAPILGLLATEMGMIRAFANLESAGSRVDPSMLAGGIWEALIGTVAGLCVAVPAMIAYYVFDGIIERVRATMKDVSIQIMALEEVHKRRENELERQRLDDKDRQRLVLEEKIRLTEYERVRQMETQRMQAEQQLQAQGQMLQAEQQRIQQERQRQLAELERMRQELEAQRAAIEAEAEAEDSGTLKLLNPKYHNF